MDQKINEKQSLIEENPNNINKKNKNEEENGCLQSMFKKVCPFLNLDFYKPYFDCTDEEILKRLRLAFFLQKDAFMNEVKLKIDLFNPVWISFGLIISLSILSNINAFLNYDGDNFEFNYSHLYKALSMVFGFFIFIPSCFFIFLLCFGVKFTKQKLFQCYSLYAYSNMYLLLAVLICFAPNDGVDFIALAAGGVFSTLFLIMVFSEFLDQFKGRMHYISLLIIIAGQALVCLSYKMVFFSNIKISDVKSI